MELDINSYWVSFITYGAPGAEDPKNLLPAHGTAGHALPRTRRPRLLRASTRASAASAHEQARCTIASNVRSDENLLIVTSRVEACVEGRPERGRIDTAYWRAHCTMTTRSSAGRIARYEARIAAYEAGDRPCAPTYGNAEACRDHDGHDPVPLAGAAAPSRRRLALRRTVALVLLVFLAIQAGLLHERDARTVERRLRRSLDRVAARQWRRVARVRHRAHLLLPQRSRKGRTAAEVTASVGVQNGGCGIRSMRRRRSRPSINPPLPGEGQWRRTGPLVNGAPPVLVTTFRPDPNYPQMVAGVAWMDRSRTSLQLYPAATSPRPGPIADRWRFPHRLRGGLLATFNSGFKLEDSGGGFAALGQVYAPLHDGHGHARRLRDGSVDVRAWTGGPQPGPSVLFARQNLPLILENGQLNPNIGEGRSGARRWATRSGSGAPGSAWTHVATSSTRPPTTRQPKASR